MTRLFNFAMRCLVVEGDSSGSSILAVRGRLESKVEPVVGGGKVRILGMLQAAPGHGVQLVLAVSLELRMPPILLVLGLQLGPD